MTRRDFLNGCLIASGGVAVGQSSPQRALAAAAGGACDGSIGDDPRALRGGDLEATFNIAHWLRDRRLSFEPGTVTLAAGCDAYEGAFSVADGGDFDTIIVGGGLAGLSAAVFVLRRRPGTKVLLIEAKDHAGGNAARDASPPLPVTASTAGAYCTVPYLDFLREIYRETGVDWEKYQIVVGTGYDSYYFDEHVPGVKPGYRGWQPQMLGRLGTLKDPPFPPRIMNDLARCHKAFVEIGNDPDGPDEPADLSHPKYDYLSQMTFAAYLTDVLHCDPNVAEFFTEYTVDCLGSTSHFVNANTAVSFLSSDYTDSFFAYPGGTSELAVKFEQWLARLPAGKKTDRSCEIRFNAVVLRVDADNGFGKQSASVTYFKDGGFHRATAKTMIVATQSQTAKQIVGHLVDSKTKAAWAEFNTVPALVANLAVRNMAPFVELDLAYSNGWWGSDHWANFAIADWTSSNRHKPDRASVLTCYGAATAPPDEFAAERMRLLETPFSDYESSLRDDLARVMRGTKFDFDRDVSAMFVYRWGHSMIMPGANSVFGSVRGPDGRLDRSKAPRRLACRPLGPISFAGQYTEGTPSVEAAIGSGHRAAGEILAHLDRT